MKEKILFLLILATLNLWLKAQPQLKLLNPHASAFLMNHGEFKGSKGVMCGESGAVAISYDEGLHWQTHFVSPFVNLKQVFIEDTAKIWLLADTLLLHSTDGGQNFQVVYIAEPDNNLCHFIRRGNVSYILAFIKGTTPNYKLLRNENNFTGSTFIFPLPAETFYSMDFRDEQRGILISNSKIYRTDDGGSHLVLAHDPGEYSLLRTIQWAGGDIFYVGGSIYSLKNKKEVNTVYYHATIWKSVDGGINWNTIEIPDTLAPNASISSISCRDANTVLAGLNLEGEENSAWPVTISFDGGLHWNKSTPAPDFTQTNSYPKSSWVMISQGRFWAWENGFYNVLSSSVDGLSFMMNDEIVTRRILAIAKNEMFAPEAKNFLLNQTSLYDFIESSFDGIHWDTVENASFYPYGRLNAMAFADFNHGMAISSYRTLSTQDGGITWNKYVSNNSSYSDFIDFSYPVHNAAFRLVDVYNTSLGQWVKRLEKTNNYGQTWTPISLPAQSVSQMMFRNTTTGYLFGIDTATGYHGYYKTEDGGQSWNWYALPSGIDVSRADMPDDSTLIIGTSDSRMFALHLNMAGYEALEIALPIGSLRSFDFSDATHGIIIMEDSLFSTAYWTENQGLDWHADPMVLPRGLKSVVLSNNLLNGYIFGNRNILIQIDDGRPVDIQPRSANPLEVIPNPATESIIIKGSGKAELCLYDLTGKLLLSELVNLPYQLSIKNMEAGVYICKLTQNGQIYTSRFVKTTLINNPF